MYLFDCWNGINIFTYLIIIKSSSIRGVVSDIKGVDVTDTDS
jgi:hypothetical protein